MNAPHPPRAEDPATPPSARTEVEHAIARRALSDRITAVTALAAGVAHELNNPLAYVIANLGFLAEKASRVVELLAGEPHTPEDLELAGQLAEALRETRTGTDRMRAVVRDLATFARPEEEWPSRVDLQPILDSCLNVAWSEIRRRHARLVRDVEPLAPVLADPGRLSQVFLNLLLNAAQFLPDAAPGAHEIRVVGRTLADGRVAVEVHDTGAGIAPEHLPRIFDPFFTTKAPGRGTGLGLSICHAVVSGLGGAIEVETAVGKGSCFRVLLPGIRPEARREAEVATSLALTPGARVLVVDDEPLVGSMLRRTLAEHDVTVVLNGEAALERLRAGERFDVVVADLIMPGMSGMELYGAVRARHPALAPRFVFLTGGAFTPEARQFLETERVEWLEKPFDVAVLREAVARRAGPLAPDGAKV